jgi:hypothetical protein
VEKIILNMEAKKVKVPRPKVKQITSVERLLCGPGPSNVPESILKVMTTPLMGHLDA